MTRILLTLPLLLAACGTPHPLANFTHKARAEAADFNFIINWNAERAEATRIGFYPSRNVTPVRRAAVEATRSVTGCDVPSDSIGGDIALVTMDLRCDGQPVRPPSPHTCVGSAEPLYPDSDSLWIDIECD